MVPVTNRQYNLRMGDKRVGGNLSRWILCQSFYSRHPAQDRSSDIISDKLLRTVSFFCKVSYPRGDVLSQHFRGSRCRDFHYPIKESEAAKLGTGSYRENASIRLLKCHSLLNILGNSSC